MGNLITKKESLASKMQNITESFILELKSVEFDELILKIEEAAKKGEYVYNAEKELDETVKDKLRLNGFFVQKIFGRNEENTCCISWRK